MQRWIVENTISRRAIARGYGCWKPHAIALRLIGLETIHFQSLSLRLLSRTLFVACDFIDPQRRELAVWLMR
jgi:hypothetical protein